MPKSAGAPISYTTPWDTIAQSSPPRNRRAFLIAPLNLLDIGKEIVLWSGSNNTVTGPLQEAGSAINLWWLLKCHRSNVVGDTVAPFVCWANAPD